MEETQMRKTRSIAAALTLAALIVPGSALADTSGGTTQGATASVPPTLTATFPTDPISWTLVPGTNDSTAQSVNVKSNSAWGLRVFVDHSSLTTWDGDSYGSASLANPLELALDGGSASAVPESASSSGVTSLVHETDAEAQAAGDAGTSMNLVFKQAFSYADAPGNYHSVITYAADQAF
jgi:hypothetical protein